MDFGCLENVKKSQKKTQTVADALIYLAKMNLDICKHGAFNLNQGEHTEMQHGKKFNGLENVKDRENSSGKKKLNYNTKFINMLTIDQLKEGKIYVTVGKSPGYVFLCKGDSSCTDYMYYKDRTIPDYSNSGHLNANTNSSFSYYEEASFEDTEWLKACILAGKGVEKPEIKHYEIY